jgi:hypothetical protein
MHPLTYRETSDFTAATILDKFSNTATAQAVERVLQKLASMKATEILAVRHTPHISGLEVKIILL